MDHKLDKIAELNISRSALKLKTALNMTKRPVNVGVGLGVRSMGRVSAWLEVIGKSRCTVGSMHG